MPRTRIRVGKGVKKGTSRNVDAVNIDKLINSVQFQVEIPA
jgi:hypothetical protein